MKVIVFGSRTWDLVELIERRLLMLPPGTTVVHGASPGGGADKIADEVARAMGLRVIPVPINDLDRAAAKSRKQVPIMRNLRMLDEHPDAEKAIGFWDGRSPGSKHMRDECLRRGLPVEMIPDT